MAAAESGHLEIVKKFIKSGARLDTVDKVKLAVNIHSTDHCPLLK